MNWIIAITWTVSLILTGKIAHAVGWRDCIRTVEAFIAEQKDGGE